MAKVNRKIPMYVRVARLRDMNIKKEYDQRNKNHYPNCIGMFPECKNLQVGQKCSSCNSCPYFSNESFQKLNGGKKMEDKTEKKQVKKIVVKDRKKKIRQMMENYTELKPSQRAWLKIWSNQGLVDAGELEELEKARV